MKLYANQCFLFIYYDAIREMLLSNASFVYRHGNKKNK